jgi:hypothetical protein
VAEAEVASAVAAAVADAAVDTKLFFTRRNI